MVIARLSLGLSFLGLRNFLKLCRDEKPCTWWLGEKGLGSLQSRLARMLHHEYDALKGYRFLGGAISFYSVSCMSDVIFNPSLLNWSSLILTVAHIYIHTHTHICVSIYLCFLTNLHFKTAIANMDSWDTNTTFMQIHQPACFSPSTSHFSHWLGETKMRSQYCHLVVLSTTPFPTTPHWRIHVGNSIGIGSDSVGGCENYATILPQKRNGYLFRRVAWCCRCLKGSGDWKGAHSRV